jgi:hypothetical protein
MEVGVTDGLHYRHILRYGVVSIVVVGMFVGSMYWIRLNLPNGRGLPLRVGNRQDSSGTRLQGGARFRALQRQYKGKFRMDDDFWAKARLLCDHWDWSMSYVQMNLGLCQYGLPTVELSLKDMESLPINRAITERQGAAGQSTARVVIRAESLSSNSFQIKTLLVHEAVHCWYGQVHGKRAGERPPWIEEGIAEWLSGDGDRSVKALCESQLCYGRDIDEVIEREHALFVSGSPTRNLGYSYLAVSTILEKCGPSKGAQRLRELFRARAWEKRIEELYAGGLGAFEEHVKSRAGAIIKDVVRNREEFREAWKYVIRGDFLGGMEAYREFVASHPDDVYTPSALVNMGACASRASLFRIADGCYSEAMARFPYSAIAAEVRSLDVENAYRMGELERAKAAGRRFIKEYGQHLMERRRVEKILRMCDR